MEDKKGKKMKNSTVAIIAIVLIAACAGGAYMVHQSNIKKMQDAGVAKLTEAIDTGLYREAEQSEIQKIIDSTEAAIRESKDQEEIDALVEKAVADTAGFKTDAIYATEEAGVKKLNDSIDLDLYREAEQKEIKEILKSTEEAISQSEDQAEIDKLIEEASSKFAEFKTDEQYTQEEEAARAAAAAAASKKSKKKSSSKGCVGTGSDVFN